MLKIRYNLETGLLTDWSDNPDDTIIASKGEAIVELDIPMPDFDDYE